MTKGDKDVSSTSKEKKTGGEGGAPPLDHSRQRCKLIPGRGLAPHHQGSGSRQPANTHKTASSTNTCQEQV